MLLSLYDFSAKFSLVDITTASDVDANYWGQSQTVKHTISEGLQHMNESINQSVSQSSLPQVDAEKGTHTKKHKNYGTKTEKWATQRSRKGKKSKNTTIRLVHAAIIHD